MGKSSRPFRQYCLGLLQHGLDGGSSPSCCAATKDQVALELPPKMHISEYVELESTQRKLYQTIRLMMNQKARKSFALTETDISVLFAPPE